MSSATTVPLTRPGSEAAKAHESGGARAARWGPWVLVAVAVGWNLIGLTAETRAVSYLDDSSVHAQMVRFATAQFALGHSPLTSWFPYLGLGSPQFLHYQSLPAMLTGLLGGVAGAGAAFRWTLYLLMGAWPVSVYASSRLFGIGRWGAAGSALVAPFLISATHIGYEQGAYVWIGYGVWTQLWASVTLPLAWGLSWRAIRDGRNFFPAALAIALTLSLHFETGYLAVLPVLVWPFAVWRSLRVRLVRAAVIVGGVLLASAWVIVPLLVERPWSATNEVLHRTALVNGYGAPRVLGWLVTGRVLDAGRLPVITLFAAIGLVLAIARWRREENGRVLVIALAVCLVLSFGRTTLGGLVDVLPGSADLFFRRFMMGAQLACVLLAGIGVAWGGRLVLGALRAGQRRLWTPFRRPAVAVVLLALAAVGVLAPAWAQLLSYQRHNARAIGAQAAADRVQGAQVDRLLAVARARGAGRVYAGMPSNWGADFTVGAVPVFKYLEARDVDEVGYTLRTASLMTDPEYYFQERNPADYLLFGIRYLVLPVWRTSPVASTPLRCAGPYCLREIREGGYVHVGRLSGRLYVTRSNVASRSLPVQRSGLALAGTYVRTTIGDGRGVSRLPLGGAPFAGDVVRESSDVSQGRMSATVELRRPGAAVFSASFDPGWHATVDGHETPVLAAAPALVATPVPAGRHTVVFRYRGYDDYPWLFAISALALVGLAGVDLLLRRRVGR